MKKSAFVVLATVLALTACEQRRDNVKQAENIQQKETAAPIEMEPSVAGDYLAARFAVGMNDLQTAETFYKQAMQNAPEDKDFLVDRALPIAIGAGDMDLALKLAKQTDLDKPEATSQLAVTLLLVDAFKQDDEKTIQQLLPKLREDGFGRLLKPLMTVWSDVGQHDKDRAIADLNRFAHDYPSLLSLVQLHTAFVYDLNDDVAQAEAFYLKTLQDNMSVRTAWITGQFYERHDQIDKAVSLYETLAAKTQGVNFASLVVRRLKNHEVHTDPFIKGPLSGIAAALYDVATVLHQENSSRLAILYAQLAYYLTPNDPFSALLLGDIIASNGADKQAEQLYQSVPKESDLYVLAQFRLAQYDEEQGNTDKAASILNDLAKEPLLQRQAYTQIGDLYRRSETFDDAIPYYSKAIATITTPAENDWALYYARGICYERDKQWDKSEADLLTALKISPQQPEVLNYLAYSWADNGKNLDKALDMLQSALANAPDDPYITDSVGWALFKNGRFTDAVPYLEAAIQQLPDDPTINDHLGDAYWKVGRELEAQFQWQRALKHAGPHDDELKAQLARKLKDGLQLTDISPVIVGAKE